MRSIRSKKPILAWFDLGAVAPKLIFDFLVAKRIMRGRSGLVELRYQGINMKCVVYKGKKRRDTYLFIEREGDFSRIPESLLNMLGELELVLSIELSEDRKLASADVSDVRKQLQEEGFYLQLPPKTYQSDMKPSMAH